MAANDPIADISALIHRSRMTSKLQKARAAQFGFLAAGATFLAAIPLGLPLALTASALLVGGSLAALIIIGLKCRGCGVSYFFDPNIGNWNISGVNLLKPISTKCGKCGAAR